MVKKFRNSPIGVRDLKVMPWRFMADLMEWMKEGK